MTDPAPFRKPGPQDVPDPITIGEQAEFDAMAEQSQGDVAASAERWRTGLAGLTAVVTGGLLLKGPENAADLDVAWRALLTALFGLGIVASIGGFWWALRASAGVPATLRFDDLRREFGSVRLFRLDAARRASYDLLRARRAALLAAILLAIAVLTWWWAPKVDDGPTVTVDHGTEQSCGNVVDSDAHGLRLAVADDPTRVTIPWASIIAVKRTASCGR